MIKASIKIFTCLLFYLATPLHAQTVNYDDVAVIVNDSSPVSVSIGNYFATARSIPASRILHVQVPDRETIDSLEFNDLRSQVEASLMTGNLLDTVNYLVTTKGMPLRVSRGGGCDSSVFSNSVLKCSCVESELPLILGPEAGEILQNAYTPNNYASADRHFDRDTFGIFLVTRLDGFTEQDVKDLIDRTGPDQKYSPVNAHMVSDLSYVIVSEIAIWNNFNAMLATNMQPTGVSFFYDPDSMAYLPPQQNLLGYYGVHYRPDLVQLGHTWEPGAMAYLHNNPAARTFDASNNPQGHLLLGDLLNDGASVAIGYVYPIYLSPSTMAFDMFPRYFDTLAMPRYNAAEAFYMGSNFLSNTAVMIGDPKTSVMADIPAAVVVGEENPLYVYLLGSGSQSLLGFDKLSQHYLPHLHH